MNHMHHEDQLVRYNALLCVQKLMVHNWYVRFYLLFFFWTYMRREKNQLLVPNLFLSILAGCFTCIYGQRCGMDSNSSFVFEVFFSQLHFCTLCAPPLYLKVVSRCTEVLAPCKTFLPVYLGWIACQLKGVFSTARHAVRRHLESVAAALLWEVLIIVPLLSWQRYRGTCATYPSGLQPKQMFVWLQPFVFFLFSCQKAHVSVLWPQIFFVFWAFFFFFFDNLQSLLLGANAQQ